MSEKVCDNKSVGLIARRGDDILIIERRKFPYGFAPPAGHMDGDPNPELTAARECEEETGVTPTNLQHVLHEKVDNQCRRQGGSWHEWDVYEGEVAASEKLAPSEDETKQALWASPEMIEALAAKTREYVAGNIPEETWQQEPGLEPVWYGFFDKLGIIAKVQ